MEKTGIAGFLGALVTCAIELGFNDVQARRNDSGLGQSYVQVAYNGHPFFARLFVDGRLVHGPRAEEYLDVLLNELRCEVFPAVRRANAMTTHSAGYPTVRSLDWWNAPVGPTFSDISRAMRADLDRAMRALPPVGFDELAGRLGIVTTTPVPKQPPAIVQTIRVEVEGVRGLRELEAMLERVEDAYEDAADAAERFETATAVPPEEQRIRDLGFLARVLAHGTDWQKSTYNEFKDRGVSLDDTAAAFVVAFEAEDEAA